jgi:hypothetical protein
VALRQALREEEESCRNRWQEYSSTNGPTLSNRFLTIAVYIMIGFAFFVLGILIHSRTHHHSADQEILLQKSHQN